MRPMPDHFPAATALLLAAAAAAQTPCFERDFGTGLALADDQVVHVPLQSFTFPFAGHNVATLGVCSNGYVWLDNGASTVADNSPTETELLAQGARFCVRWCDLDPPQAPPGGGVFYREIPAGGGLPARAVITWDRVPHFADPQRLTTMQVQFDANGAITTAYEPDQGGAFPADAAIVGATAGGGAPVHRVDFAALPFTGPGPTAYQVFAPGAFAFGSSNVLWTPAGGGFAATAPACPRAAFVPFGRGCPQDLTAYESFGNGAFDLANASIRFAAGPWGYTAVPGPGLDPGYSSQIPGVGDDTIHQGLQLGFPFPFAGATVTSVDLSSNGYLWLASNALSDFTPSVVHLVGDDPRIAALWRDLDCTTGQVFFDAVPGRAMATWVAVPDFGGGGARSTFQIELFANGDFALNYGSCNATPALVGVSEGHGAFDPGSIDLSANVPGLALGRSGRAPLALAAAAGSAPVVGGPFTLLLDRVPAGAPVVAFVLGFAAHDPGLDLAPLGMAGCRQFVSADANVLALPGLGTATSTVQIPNAAAFYGYVLYAQGAAFVPGFDALGVVASNGGAVRMGF
jgi:hypothetical protein